MKIIRFTLLFCLVWASLAQAEVVSKIAAVVNDDIITTHQLDLKLADYLATKASGKVLAQDQVAKLRKQLLQRLIEDTLVKQQIRKLNIQASDAEVDAAIDDVQRQNQITRDQLKAAVEAQGLSFADYREKMRDQILHFKLIGREVQSKIDVTHQEILDYFRNHIDDFRGPPVLKLSNLLVPLPAKPSTAQIEQAGIVAKAALEQLRGGKTIDQVVSALPAGEARGGDMGEVHVADLSTQIRNALAGVAVGGYSEPVNTPAGLIIFRVDERSPGKIRNFDEVKIEIRQKLTDRDREERFKQWSAGLEKNAYIDIRI